MNPAPDPAPWWDSAVVYQIYPRSFCDTNGDGVGDLEGIRRHLDHVARLGADAVWVSPFFPSPMADFGYDVSDYCDVDPLFGSLDDFDRLVADAHALGVKVLIDWVPNHSSNRHPWFVAARSSRDDPHRDWYIWRDDRPDSAGGHGPPGSPGRLPNNWRAAFAGVGGGELPPAWTWDEGSGQWYLHSFLPEQPDLNWANPQLREAMIGTLRFWLARGVDGFRIDVVHGLGKDPALPDLPPELEGHKASSLNDDPRTHPILAEIRRAIDAWPEPPPRMMVGEVYLFPAAKVAPYYGTPEAPELHLSFNFAPLFAPWEAPAWQKQIDEARDVLLDAGKWPTWVLSNHDNPRHRTRYGGSEARARAAAVLLLTLPGTPFLYQGEELGLADARIPPSRRVDPGGRDGCRAPLPWTDEPDHGWVAGSAPWLPWPPEADNGRTVAGLAGDPSSILSLYRDLLAARRASPALALGDFSWLDGDGALAARGALAWRRRHGNDVAVVAVNFTSTPVEVALPPGSWRVVAASDQAPEKVRVGGGALGLGPDLAVVLAPAAS